MNENEVKDTRRNYASSLKILSYKNESFLINCLKKICWIELDHHLSLYLILHEVDEDRQSDNIVSKRYALLS